MEKNISFNAPKEIEINTIRWQGEDIQIKEFISFGEMLSLVNRCVEGSFGVDGEYLPELTDFYLKKETVDIYTNIALGEDPYEVYSLLYNTDIFDKVIENINLYQYEEIRRSIDRKIGHTLRSNAKEYNTKFDNIISALDQLSGNFMNIFSDTPTEDIAKLFGMLNRGEVDNEKLAESYIKEHEEVE